MIDAEARLNPANAQMQEAAASTSPAPEQKTMTTDDYPLDTCVVSGDKLGAMGEPVVYEYKGRKVKFCCKGCIKDFEKDPAKYLEKIDNAKKKSQ